MKCCWNSQIWAVQKYANLVDLKRSCKINVHFQKSGSIQTRTSPPRFGLWRKKLKVMFWKTITVTRFGQPRLYRKSFISLNRLDVRTNVSKGLKRLWKAEPVQGRRIPKNVSKTMKKVSAISLAPAELALAIPDSQECVVIALGISRVWVFECSEKRSKTKELARK